MAGLSSSLEARGRLFVRLPIGRGMGGGKIATTFPSQTLGGNQREREQLRARKISLSGMSWKHIQHTKLIQEAGRQRIESGQGVW